MIRPQQQAPAVFGKPWFWHRSSISMDGTRSLARVILEMSGEIHKLEAENRQLKGDYGEDSFHRTAEQESLTINLRRNVSAPVLENKYTENTVMTVRRYSISSNVSGVTLRDGRSDGGHRGESGWGRLQEEVHLNSRRADVGTSNRHSLQEYVHKTRSKAKTVTFLLPVDDIYTSRPVLPQRERDIPQLESITEN